MIPSCFIAIEGVIGAGKTTLASMLAEMVPDARLLLEQFEENPFLPKFYTDPEHYAFPAQMFFLMSRFRQQTDLAQYNLFQTTVVSDYTFQKDEIFARLTLNETEFALYQQIVLSLRLSIPKPDCILYLRSSVDQLMTNIQRRGRDYEVRIDREYITRLHDAYEHFFSNYREVPVLAIDTAQIDTLQPETARKIWEKLSDLLPEE